MLCGCCHPGNQMQNKEYGDEKEVAVAIAVGTAIGGLAMTSGADARRCGSQPDFDPSFINSTGEAVVMNDPTAKTDETHPATPGQTTRLICAGAPLPPPE